MAKKAADKAPAYQWYPRDFAADELVLAMTLEQEGAYRRLLDYQWLNGSIPEDIALLATICRGIPVSRMKVIWAMVKPCFVPVNHEPGRLVNRRMEQDRTKLEIFVRNAAKFGRNGNLKRWDKDRVPDPLPDPLPDTDPIAYPTPTRSGVDRSVLTTTTEISIREAPKSFPKMSVETKIGGTAPVERGLVTTDDILKRQKLQALWALERAQAEGTS